MADPDRDPDRPLRMPFRVAALPARTPQRFDLCPDAPARAALARHLGIAAVHDLRFTGEIRPTGGRDVALSGRLVARIEQPCGITLDPVVTAIDEPVERRYIAGMPEPQGPETEMSEDDTQEPLPEVIDAGAVATEALALAVPPFPRVPGAALDRAAAAPRGADPLDGEGRRPFSGLAAILSAQAARPPDETR